VNVREVESSVNEIVFQVGLMEVQLSNAINDSAHGKELLLPSLHDYKTSEPARGSPWPQQASYCRDRVAQVGKWSTAVLGRYDVTLAELADMIAKLERFAFAFVEKRVLKQRRKKREQHTQSECVEPGLTECVRPGLPHPLLVSFRPPSADR